jgi:hypothetical protein
MTDRDPRSELEEQGIPDLQDGYPEQQWAEDVGPDSGGFTAEEAAIRVERED